MLKVRKEIKFFKNFSFPTFKILILTKHIIIIKYINYIIFSATEMNSKLFCFRNHFTLKNIFDYFRTRNPITLVQYYNLVNKYIGGESHVHH